MKSKFFLLINLLIFCFFGILSNVYATSYWVIQKDTQRLLRIQKDTDDVRIVEAYPVIDVQADYVINPNDNTCWVTSAFQGQVTRYGKGKSLVISNFGAPMSLALDVEREVLWVADGALNQIVKMRLDGAFEKRIQLRASSRSIASRADGGLWIATNRGLIVLDSNGDVINELERKAKYLSRVPGKNEVWLANPVNNHVMHLDGDGNVLAEGRLKSLSGLIAAKDGGCILLGRETAFRLDADGTRVGTLRELDRPSHIVYQPTDESVWILQSRGKQLVQLPKEFDQESVTAIVGLRGDDARVEPVAGVRWIPKAGKPESQEAGKPESEKVGKPKEEESPMPPEKTEPPEKIEPEKEKPIPEKPPKPDEPEGEKPVTPEPESENDEPSEETENVEEVKPTKLDDTTEPPEKIEPEKEKPIPEEPPKPTVVPAPSTSTLLSEPPKFENGGLALVKLHEGLSSTRVKNVPQAMGRRYVWNFGEETYTLLLGLSVEAYNSYTNRERAKWVEMIVEGVHVAKPIAEEFRKLADKKGWTTEQSANFVLAFVQCLPYTVDDVSTGVDDFPRYAIETLVTGGGDCEDTTILAGSILLLLGYDVLALNPEGHLALGIKGKFDGYYFEHNEIRYYYSETTGTGWKIGEMPDIYKGVPVTLYEVPKQTKP